VTGCWASQSISRSGWSLRSSSAIANVAPRVAEADRRGDEEHAPAPRAAARPAPRERRRAGEVPQQEVDFDGVARVQEVSAALDRRERPACRLGERLAARVRRDRVRVAVDDEHRAAHARAELPDPLLGERRRLLGRDERLRGRLEAPADSVLDLLRRVRLRHAPREEERQEAAVVAQPVVLVELRPPFVGLARLVEGVDAVLRVRRGEWERRRDEDGAFDARRMLGGQKERALRAERERDEHRPLRPRRVHHRERVGRELGLRVRLRLLRAIGAAVAAPEGDDARVTRGVRDLRLPAARVDDRPARQEEDRRLAAPVDLVEDPDPVALDVAFVVGVARPRLLVDGRPREPESHSASFRTSQTSIQASSSR